MYFYPKPNNSDYFNPICINNKLHSMGDSLYPYLQMKIHSSLCFNNINTIKIVGEFDRDSIISERRFACFSFTLDIKIRLFLGLSVDITKSGGRIKK